MKLSSSPNFVTTSLFLPQTIRRDIFVYTHELVTMLAEFLACLVCTAVELYEKRGGERAKVSDGVLVSCARGLKYL